MLEKLVDILKLDQFNQKLDEKISVSHCHVIPISQILEFVVECI